MKNTEWLVTVMGYNVSYNPPTETVSRKVILGSPMTPVEWFLKKPTVYSRFSFVPRALIGFWKIKEVS